MTNTLPSDMAVFKVSGWLPIDGRLIDTDGWIVAPADCAGYGHDDDAISRAVAVGKTRAAALKAYRAWAAA